MMGEHRPSALRARTPIARRDLATPGTAAKLLNLNRVAIDWLVSEGYLRVRRVRARRYLYRRDVRRLLALRRAQVMPGRSLPLFAAHVLASSFEDVRSASLTDVVNMLG